MALTPATTMSSPHASTNGNTTEDVAIANFWARYDHIKAQDSMKNLLLEDVITRLEQLAHKHNDLLKERDNEHDFVANFRQRERQLQQSVSQLQRILNRDPFILVLVDGNDFIFDETHLREGAAGGKRIADLFHDAVADWASSNVIECAPDVRVVVRVFVNLQALAHACARAGLVTHPSLVEDFAKSFTCGQKLFDIVDVQNDDETVSAKMIETFKLYALNYHCRQILFGCSSDVRYINLLRQYSEDGEVQPRITLLQGVSSSTEMSTLPFRSHKFNGFFRQSKLALDKPIGGISDLRLSKDGRTLNASTRAFTPRSSSLTPVSSPLAQYAQLDTPVLIDRTNHLRGASITSSTNSSGIASPTNTWATLAKQNAAKPVMELPPRVPPLPAMTVIRRNKKGQRLDEPLEYEKDEVQRLKKMKMCNQFYIGMGCCHYEAGKADKCPHRHDIKLTTQEKYYLRVVARETPCKRGSDCDDPKCIYGHKCPFPPATEGTMRGAGCLNGDNCRFPREMHGMDLAPAKLIKVTGTF